MLEVHCPVCSKKYRVEERFGGRRMRCKGCGGTIEVPKSGGVEAAPAAASPPPSGSAVDSDSKAKTTGKSPRFPKKSAVAKARSGRAAGRLGRSEAIRRSPGPRPAEEREPRRARTLKALPLAIGGAILVGLLAAGYVLFLRPAGQEEVARGGDRSQAVSPESSGSEPKSGGEAGAHRSAGEAGEPGGAEAVATAGGEGLEERGSAARGPAGAGVELVSAAPLDALSVLPGNLDLVGGVNVAEALKLKSAFGAVFEETAPAGFPELEDLGGEGTDGSAARVGAGAEASPAPGEGSSVEDAGGENDLQAVLAALDLDPAKDVERVWFAVSIPPGAEGGTAVPPEGSAGARERSSAPGGAAEDSGAALVGEGSTGEQAGAVDPLAELGLGGGSGAEPPPLPPVGSPAALLSGFDAMVPEELAAVVEFGARFDPHRARAVLVERGLLEAEPVRFGRLAAYRMVEGKDEAPKGESKEKPTRPEGYCVFLSPRQVLLASPQVLETVAQNLQGEGGGASAARLAKSVPAASAESAAWVFAPLTSPKAQAALEQVLGPLKAIGAPVPKLETLFLGMRVEGEGVALNALFGCPDAEEAAKGEQTAKALLNTVLLQLPDPLKPFARKIQAGKKDSAVTLRLAFTKEDVLSLLQAVQGAMMGAFTEAAEEFGHEDFPVLEGFEEREMSEEEDSPAAGDIEEPDLESILGEPGEASTEKP